MFLAQVDPLRRLEFNWRDRPEAHQLLMSEIKTQGTSVGDTDYRRALFCKVIGALSGAALPAVGTVFQDEQPARTLCNLHGEDWSIVRNQMLASRLLRCEHDGKLSMSTVGANFLDGFAAAKFKQQLGASEGSIAARVGDDALAQMAMMHPVVKDKGASDSGDRMYPTSHNVSSGQTIPRLSSSSRRLNAGGGRKPYDTDEVRLRLQSASPVSVINQLEQCRSLQNIAWVLKAVMDRPAAIWQCTVGNATYGRFVGYGLSKKSASRSAASAFCADLIQENTFHHRDFIDELMSSRDRGWDAPGDRCRILIELSVLLVETSSTPLVSQTDKWEVRLTLTHPWPMTVSAVGQAIDSANHNAICKMEKALAEQLEKHRIATKGSPHSASW